MNCKPGDLAIVIRDPLNIGILGRLVEVLYLAPAEEFQLPNGRWNEGAHEPGAVWVIRILGSKVMPPRCFFLTDYGTGSDSGLRPLPGLSEDERRDEKITA